jgi:hypothetical protein
VSSRALSDSRILDAVVATIRSAARPAIIRDAAIDVLVSYAIPHAAYPPLSSARNSAAIKVEALLAIVGSSSPAPTAASTALAEIQAATSASDPDVRAHAAQLAPALARAMAARRDTVDPAKITLAYVCGKRFRVRNYNATDVVLSYDVTGSFEAGVEVRVPPPSGGLSYGERQFITSAPGQVQLRYLRSLIQTAGNRGTTCP